MNLPKNLETMQTIGKSTGWEKMSTGKSILHQNEDGVEDLKFYHTDGREVVYDGATGKSIKDPRFVGTFNYITAAESTLGHIQFDVVPWVEMGNARNDPTTVWKRHKMLIPQPKILPPNLPEGIPTPYQLKLQDHGF